MSNTHVITSSPFTDYANGDYTPIVAYHTSGDLNYYDSQYLNNSYIGQEYPTTDLAGNPRFDGQGSLSIGAYQYDENTNSVNDLELSKVKVYPNPVVDFVQIEAVNTINNVIVSNYIGQEIMTFNEINSSEFMFDTKHLKTGVYNVVITMNNGRKQLKSLVK